MCGKGMETLKVLWMRRERWEGEESEWVPTVNEPPKGRKERSVKGEREREKDDALELERSFSTAERDSLGVSFGKKIEKTHRGSVRLGEPR